MKRFEQKVVLVTGAAAGIGRATAERLASEGASLFLVDLAEGPLGGVAERARAIGVSVESRRCDVADEADAAAAVAACVERFGQLDVLVNCAGILRFASVAATSLEEWELVMRVNATGTFLMCRAAVPHLLETRGNVVNIASTAGLRAQPWAAAYSASKGAVLAFTRVLAIDLVKQGVRANCVCPGSIETSMMKQDLPADVDMKLIRRTESPRGPAGPEKVASVVAMLASEDGSHINGDAIRVDGGTLS